MFSAVSDDEEELRTLLVELLRHIRFCTMTDVDFNKEVATTGILTDGEIASVVKMLGGKTGCKKSTGLCYDLISRDLFNAIDPESALEIDFPSYGFSEYSSGRNESVVYLTTDTKAVHLLSAEFKSVSSDEDPYYYRFPPKGLTSQFKCKVSLLRVTNYTDDTSSEEPLEFNLEEVVPFDAKFSLSLGQNLKLLPLNKYKLAMNCEGIRTYFWYHCAQKVVDCEGLIISWDTNAAPGIPWSAIKYQTV